MILTVETEVLAEIQGSQAFLICLPVYEDEYGALVERY
jgi:hypothetical protein